MLFTFHDVPVHNYTYIHAPPLTYTNTYIYICLHIHNIHVTTHTFRSPSHCDSFVTKLQNSEMRSNYVRFAPKKESYFFSLFFFSLFFFFFFFFFLLYLHCGKTVSPLCDSHVSNPSTLMHACMDDWNALDVCSMEETHDLGLLKQSPPSALFKPDPTTHRLRVEMHQAHPSHRDPERISSSLRG